MTNLNIMWLIFAVLTTFLFLMDLKLSSRSKEITQKESVILCLFWVTVAVLFGLLIGHMLGSQKMLEFYTGYIIEYTLSMDNMFVFLLIFSYFSIPKKYQPKILTWGIIGAVVMRFIFLFAGVKLLNSFHWLIYIFGAVLILSAIKMALQKEDGMDPSKNPLLNLIGKFIPMETTINNADFFIIKKRRSMPLLFLPL